MKIDTNKLDKCLSHNLPNGAFAVTDLNGKMLGYCRHPEKAKGNQWDWVHRNYRKGG